MLGYAPFLGQVRLLGKELGQTSAEWEARAKAAVSKFRELEDRTWKVSKIDRENIFIWLGDVKDPATPRGKFVAVDAFIDVHRWFDLPGRTPPVIALEGVLPEFEAKVKNAEQLAAAGPSSQQPAGSPSEQASGLPQASSTWTYVVVAAILGGVAWAIYKS